MANLFEYYRFTDIDFRFYFHVWNFIVVFTFWDFISKGINGRKVELEEIQESQSIDTPMEELEQETQVVV